MSFPERTAGAGRPTPTALQTERLVLRAWRDSDLGAFAEINADRRVTEYLPATLSRGESDQLAGRIRDDFAARGFGLWAVEVIGGAAFIGFVGLSRPRFEAHFTPCVEMGWRIAWAHWGKGYASEAARAVRDFAFAELGLDEVVAFTVPANSRSRRVMEKLGMSHRPQDDFDHPLLPAGDALRRQVLYRLARPTGPHGVEATTD